MDLELAGKTVLVTGASRGIGLATARAFAREGANLVLVARSVGDVEEAANRIAADYLVAASPYAYDLATDAEVCALNARLPPIDILVNNAGAIPPGDLAAIDDATWRQAWDLKVMGYISMTRALAKGIAARKGAIINVIGAGAETLDPAYICGAVGNAALVAFTRAYARQFSKMGGRIVGLNPGAVKTSRMELFLRARAREKFGDESRAPELVAQSPYGRFADPEEIADAIVFLASSRSGYTNGTILSIHGGG
jgi:3-oxoacyl-[acyl-carrier protein] reductase